MWISAVDVCVPSCISVGNFLENSFQGLFYIPQGNSLAQVRLNRLFGYLCSVSLCCLDR